MGPCLRKTLILISWSMLVMACAAPVDPAPASLQMILEQRHAPPQTWQERPPPAEIDERTAALLAAPLGVDDAVQIALLNHPGVQANLKDLDANLARALEETPLANPEVGAEVLFGAGHPKVEAELGLDLVPLFEIALRRDIARSEGEGARFEAASALLEFIFAMRMAYYEHVAHRQRLAIEEELFELTRAAATTAQTLHEAGNITSLELFTREALRGEGRRAVFEARGAYRSSRRRLHHLMGLEERADHQRWEVLDALPAPESARNLAQPTETSLAIAMQRREMHAIRDELRLTRRRGWLPELFVGIATEYEDEDWKVGPSLRLALPLFDRQGYRADTLRAREMALHFRIDAEHRRLSAQVAELEERVELAREMLRHIEEELLPLRGRIVAEALLQYNAMELSVFDLLEARRAQINAERDRIDALLDFWRMRARQDFVGAGGLLNALD